MNPSHHARFSVLTVLCAAALSGCVTSLPRPSDETASVIVAGAGVVSQTHAATAKPPSAPKPSAQVTKSANLTPTREPAPVMRIWVAPWEDSAGNLHGASHVFTEVLPRRWQLASATDTPATTVLTPLQIEPRQASTSDATRKP